MTYHSTPGHVETDEQIAFVTYVLQVMEDPRLLMVPETLTGTTVTDSSQASHNLTASESVAGWVSHTTRAPVYDLDGSADFLYCADHADFSFGNESTDSAFSVFALANSDDGATARLWVAKSDIYTAHDCEWLFGPYVNGKYGLFLCDAVSTVAIGRYKDTVFSSGTWQFVVGTYDGSSTKGGVKIYNNGTQVDDTDYEYGSYTAMHNTTQDLHIGCAQFDTGHAGWWDGKVGCVGICGKELSSSDVWRLTKVVREYFGV